MHQPIPESDLDPDAVKIVQRLTRFEHAAYLVGGCVRDLLLERKPKDFDIGTSATPRQIRRLFRNCRIIGRRFRLAHIYFQNGKVIEVATFRGQDEDAPEGNAKDLLIRDDNQFGTLEEDALRRDFTINSLFYDLNNGTVLDHADGLGDLRRRLVRTIGDPTIRFKEDPIRILRAIKFAARLDFEIEPATLAALRGTRGEIPKAAAPRILEELNRFCRGGAARRSFEILRENDILSTIVPEIAERYGNDASAWTLLYRLLDDFDRQAGNGTGEIGTGRILCALLLPLYLDGFGWSADGSVRRVEDLDVRAEVDSLLRPVAVRLRVSRKDQEICRQILTTLQRMVPAGGSHRNTRRTLARRGSFPEALSILESLAAIYGGKFAESAAHWRPAGGDRGRVESEPRESTAREGDEEPTGEARPRRRRGGRRRRRRGEERVEQVGEDAPQSRPVAAKPAGRELPPVWDDDYFFAALPSVPEDSGHDVEGDRYGTAAADDRPRDVPPPEEEEETAPETTARPRRRRRSRRRRRPPGESQGEPRGGSGETSGSD